MTASPAASSLEPAASLLEPAGGALPPSSPACEEDIAFSEVRDVYLLPQVHIHEPPRCGHRSCCRKGYVEVVSGGITFTASVDACATPFVLQLNFDSLEKVDGVRRTGQYLEFKEGSVVHMFDFGDTPNFETVTLFVQKVALAAISARRAGVRGLESPSVDAADERVRKRNKSASGGGAAGGASDMDVELEVTLEETPAGGVGRTSTQRSIFSSARSITSLRRGNKISCAWLLGRVRQLQ